MKVCQIMAGDEEGGLENHFVELSNGLVDHVDSVVAIGHEKYRSRFAPGVKFIALDLSRGRRNLLQLARLITILRRESPDIVHAQANKAVDMLARISAFVPGYRIGTLHSRKKTIGMYAAMHTVIGVSKGVVANLDHPHVRVVYNGVQAYSGKPWNKDALAKHFALDPELPISLSVGRLVPTKAFDNLVSAWEPQHGQLIIVGEGPQRGRLQEQIRYERLDGRVVLAGFCPDVRGMMSGADLLIFASHREGFSYALAEALLCRLPVLSTRVPGAEEVLPDQYLVPTNDIAALKQALSDTIADLPAAQKSQAELFRWAAETLTVEHMVSATERIYREVLGIA
jgi:glycosyltransferase involved in cell wall biosynthesis